MESDEELHARTRSGDLRAFDQLYLRYERPLFSFLLGRFRSRVAAEDALQEVFLRALKTPPRELGEAGFRPWLFRVARNHTFNTSRDAARAAVAATRMPLETPPPTAEEQLAREELRAALDGAVERLPPLLAEVYHLRIAGLSYEEMADVLGAPLGTVKSRMHQMVRQLRDEVSPWTAPE
jgi:RNA polymerase sigma-70 factor (ECF subfamily)